MAEPSQRRPSLGPAPGGVLPAASAPAFGLLSPDPPTLDYGQTRSANAITCDSEPSGMTCTDSRTVISYECLASPPSWGDTPMPKCHQLLRAAQPKIGLADSSTAPVGIAADPSGESVQDRRFQQSRCLPVEPHLVADGGRGGVGNTGPGVVGVAGGCDLQRQLGVIAGQHL